MTRYFGFAMSDSMFPGQCSVTRIPISVDHVKELVARGVVSCLNPSHATTIEAMRSKFGLAVEIPAQAPRVALGVGDSVVVMSVRGLPRLDATRHEYTEAEIAGASFAFGIWTVTA